MVKNRALALILCVVLCLSLFFSAAFIAVNHSHFCIGGHCQICAELSVCAALLRIVSTNSTLVSAALLSLFIVAAARGAAPMLRRLFSPVSHKVKLLN